ncbi:MAG: SusE domain-containing protein, partial [Bacteroidales bacterium]|nr:SusE domain-containing protein [Bacteroidales bacterium]
MKNIILIFSAALGMVLFFSSCEKNDNEPKLNLESSVASEITTPENGATYILTLADSANPFVVNWTATTYSISEGAALPLPTYSLQMVFADSSFDGAKELYHTQDIFFETIIYKFNNALYSMGMAADSTGDIDLRVVGGISGADYTQVPSEIITLTVTPFEPPTPPTPTVASLWIPGDYQGWDPASAPQIYSYTNDGVYKGYMYMPEGGTYEFKFTSAPDWDHTNFGYLGEGLLDTDPEAGNLTMPGPGGYQVVVDTINLTWSGYEEPQNWGVIGEWLAWADDIDMLWDDENQYLYVTVED